MLKIIDKKDKKIRSLELEISKSKMANRHNKRKVWEEYQWTGEEANFTETVNSLTAKSVLAGEKLVATYSTST